MNLSNSQNGSHPSDYQLDQLYLDELADEVARDLRAHLKLCLPCSKRQKLRDPGLSAFPTVNSDALLKRVLLASSVQSVSVSETNNSGVKAQRSTSFRWRWSFALAPLLCAAALLLFVRLPSDDTGSASLVGNDQDIRTKGSLGLRVFRQNQHGAEELISGQRLSKGDTIGFVVDIPAQLMSKPMQAMLVGTEDIGKKTTVYFPSGQTQSAILELDSEGALPTATVLDDYVGQETLLLVICPSPFPLSSLGLSANSKGNTVASEMPISCLQTQFRMDKKASE